MNSAYKKIQILTLKFPHFPMFLFEYEITYVYGFKQK